MKAVLPGWRTQSPPGGSPGQGAVGAAGGQGRAVLGQTIILTPGKQVNDAPFECSSLGGKNDVKECQPSEDQNC